MMNTYEKLIKESKKKELPLKNNYYLAKLDYYRCLHRRFYLEMQQSLEKQNKKHRHVPTANDSVNANVASTFCNVENDNQTDNDNDNDNDNDEDEKKSKELTPEAKQELKHLYVDLCKHFHPDRQKLVASTNEEKMQMVNMLYKEKNLEALKQMHDNLNTVDCDGDESNTKSTKHIFVDIEAIKKEVKMLKASECYIWATQPQKREIIEGFYVTDEEYEILTNPKKTI